MFALSFFISLLYCIYHLHSVTLHLPFSLPTLHLSIPLSLLLPLPFLLLFHHLGGWYLMIVCGQAAHIWMCRTTTVSIFQHGVFSNRVTNFGVIIALLLGCFVTYTPGTVANCVPSLKFVHCRVRLCVFISLSHVLSQ